MEFAKRSYLGGMQREDQMAAIGILLTFLVFIRTDNTPFKKKKPHTE